MDAVERIELPPLPARRRDYDPEERCAMCGNSGWEQVYELVTWRQFSTKREVITKPQYEAYRGQVEGVGVRAVYPAVKPCRCSKGKALEESFRASQGDKIEPLRESRKTGGGAERKPAERAVGRKTTARREDWTDGKARASNDG